MTDTQSAAIPSRARGIVRALEGFADRLSLAAAYLAAGFIVALTLFVLAGIFVALLSRFFPDMPAGIPIAWEYSAYLMGGAFVLGAGMTLRAGLQIRVEVLLTAGNGVLARGLEIIAGVIGSAVTIFLAYTLTMFALRNYGYGEVSQDSGTPVWIPQVILALGSLVLCVQMVARTLAAFFMMALERPELGAATAIEPE